MIHVDCLGNQIKACDQFMGKREVGKPNLPETTDLGSSRRIPRTSSDMAAFMEFSDNYNRDKEVQRGFRDDGRAATGDGLHTPSVNPLLLEEDKESVEMGLWVPPSIPWLRRERDMAIQAFITLNETFNLQNLGGKFNNFDEAWAARKAVDKAFEKLCAIHGEFVAATEGSWIDITVYKPAHMDDVTAYKKKKVAVSDARIILRVAKARAMRVRAELVAEKAARAAEETAQRIRIYATEEVEKIAIANAAAAEAAAKEAK